MFTFKINILIIFLLITFSVLNLSSQTSLKASDDSFLSLKPAPQLSDEQLLQLKINELLNLGDAFLYHKQLLNHDYEIEFNKLSCMLRIINNESTKEWKSSNRKRNLATLQYKKILVNINGIYYSDLQLEDENKYVNYQKAKNIILENEKSISNQVGNGLPMIVPLLDNNILIDLGILENVNGHNYGKILCRTVTRQNMITMQNQPCDLFADLTDGIIIPYGSGQHGKILTVDKCWNRIIWTDKDVSYPFAQAFGSGGSGQYQFNCPKGIAKGAPTQSGSVLTYDLYASDYFNNSLDKMTFRHWPDINNVFHSDIVNFSREPNIEKPIDIEVHTGGDINSSYDDWIFFTQDIGNSKKLRFGQPNYYGWGNGNGNYLYVHNFKYNGLTYWLNPSRIAVCNVSNGQNNNYDILACVDDFMKIVVFFKLNHWGSMVSYENECAEAFAVFKFPSNYSLTSVKIYMGNPALGNYAWVTSNDANGNGFLHEFKILTLGNNYEPVSAQYIASTSKGKNSNTEFKFLNNQDSQNGFIDIFTSENWANDYGIRRYKPGLSLLNYSNTSYCLNTGMQFNFRLTNPGTLSFSNIYYTTNSGANWTPTSITGVNGIISSNGNYYLPAGTSIVSIHINVPNITARLIAGGDDILPHQVKFDLDLAPQDEVPAYNSQNRIHRHVDEGFGSCNSGGGCPYLYVDDGNTLKQDNNILHRSEFTEYLGQDITDVYKLNVPPAFDSSSNTCKLQIQELNNDLDYFDRFQLKAIDHPIGTNVAITENKDIVLYFPQIIINPTNALLNDTDVTCSLAYDSTCSPINGDSSATIISTNSNLWTIKGRKFKLHFINSIQQTLNTVLKLRKPTIIQFANFNQIQS